MSMIVASIVITRTQTIIFIKVGLLWDLEIMAVVDAKCHWAEK